MTTLASSPLLVALMQTAASLPFFMLAFPAGALADIVDRRRLLLWTQTWMLAFREAVATALMITAARTIRPTAVHLLKTLLTCPPIIGFE